MNQATELLGLHQLARALGISAAWLKVESDAGRIPHLRAGRRRLYSLAAVRAKLAERAAEGTGAAS